MPTTHPQMLVSCGPQSWSGCRSPRPTSRPSILTIEFDFTSRVQLSPWTTKLNCLTSSPCWVRWCKTLATISHVQLDPFTTPGSAKVSDIMYPCAIAQVRSNEGLFSPPSSFSRLVRGSWYLDLSIESMMTVMTGEGLSYRDVLS